MRTVVWLILVFTAAVVAAVAFGHNDGLVSFFWGGWRADLSLNLFVIGLIVTGAIVLLAAQAVIALLALPRRAAQWRALRRERAAQSALREALAEFFSARYSRAHKAAQRALTVQADAQGDAEAGTDREFAVLAHLLAAGSLHRLADRERRDEQVRRLNELLAESGGVRRADDGARLLGAEWALDDRDAERALALLAELPPGVARRTQALRLKLQAARMARQPLEALHTARLLANHQAFSADVATGLLRSLASEALMQAHDAEQLRRVWERFDAADRRDPHVAARAAERAASLGAAEEGRRWLRPHWEDLSRLEPDARERVARALTRVLDGMGMDWLPLLEAALQSSGREPAVQAAVGLAFAERQLWGKSKGLLEGAARDTTLATDLRRLAWYRLAGIAREDGDEARAAVCEHAAAELGA